MAPTFRCFWFAFLLLASGGAWSCAICAPSDAQNLFMARLAAADAVVLAAPEPNSSATPIKALKGAMPQGPVTVVGWQTGAVQERKNPKDALLLFFNAGSRTWWAAGYLDERRIEWLGDALAWASVGPQRDPQGKRLRFFARFLEDEQPLIAQAAFEEVSTQPYAQLRTLAQELDAAQIGKWVQHSTVASRKPLYWLLWGFGGGKTAAALAQQEAKPAAARSAQRSAAELSAQVAVLLEVRGTAGVQWARQSYLVADGATDAEVQAVLLALGTLANEGQRIQKDELIPVYASFIRSNPHRAGFVASDLAAWGRWEFAEEFAAALRSRRPQVFASRYAMVFYLLRNPRPEARALMDALKAEKLI